MRGKELRWWLRKIGIKYKKLAEWVKFSENTVQRRISFNMDVPEYWVIVLERFVNSKARVKKLEAEYQKSLTSH